MPTNSIHIGDSERPTPHHHIPRSTQVLVTLATLFLLGTLYGIWHVFRADAPMPEFPETGVPAPAR